MNIEMNYLKSVFLFSVISLNVLLQLKLTVNFKLFELLTHLNPQNVTSSPISIL